MLLNGIKSVSYIFCSFILKSLSTQDFGCYNVSSDNQCNGVFTSDNFHSSLSDFDWTIFKVEKSEDGYYKDYYKESAYFPKKLKLEGNILNGVKNGRWTLHFENGIYFITGNYFNGKKEGIWNDYTVNKAYDTIWISKANFKKDTIEGDYTEYFKNGKISKITNYIHGVGD